MGRQTEHETEAEGLKGYIRFRVVSREWGNGKENGSYCRV